MTNSEDPAANWAAHAHAKDCARQRRAETRAWLADRWLRLCSWVAGR